MSCKVGNQTNSQDPQAVNSRVFVGNLNTFQCSKTDVERIFQRYGRIAGISMHKGYAFIQFTNPFDARSACLGEDGRLIWGQTLDVNMVAEPKSHQTGRKRQNIAKTGNDWDYYYDSLKVQLESLYRSYYASVGLPPGPRLVPPLKRPRIHGPATSRPSVKTPSPNKASHPNNLNTTNNITTVSTASLTDLKTYSTPDILICGNCREHFAEVEQLIEHKKTYCKLRFTCKCHLLNGSKLSEEPASLLCSQCKDSFSSAWDLMVHVQAAHMLNIYQLSSDPSSGGSSRDQSETREFKHMGGMIGDGIPNGLNPNGTLMGDSLMEDSHCQTDLSSTASSSSTSSIMSACSQQIITQNNHHLHNHHHPQQQQQQQHHNTYHHLHNNRIEDSSTMTDVATSTGMEIINTPSSLGQHHIITSGISGNVVNANCVLDNAPGAPSQQQQNSIGTGTPNTIMANSVMMTDGNNGVGGGGGGGTATNQQNILVNANDSSGITMCSSSQCSTPVNHSTLANGPFTNTSTPSSQGGQLLVGGQVHSNFLNSNNNNNNNNNNHIIGTATSSNSSLSSSSFEAPSSSMTVAVSQPMEASTQTQTMQVEESLLNHHTENNNGPSSITNNNQSVVVVGGGGGTNGGTVGTGGGSAGMPTNFDEHCSIVSTLKQESSAIHLPFTNGQVASI